MFNHQTLFCKVFLIFLDTKCIHGETEGMRKGRKESRERKEGRKSGKDEAGGNMRGMKGEGKGREGQTKRASGKV